MRPLWRRDKLERSAIGLEQRSRDRQPQAGPSLFAFAGEERVEDAIPVASGNSRAIIDQIEADRGGVGGNGYPIRKLSSLPPCHAEKQ